MRTLVILAGLILLVFGLIFMGLDLLDTLEAHGILVASSISSFWGDIWGGTGTSGADAVIADVCAPLPGMCSPLLHKGLHLYTWVIPSVCGVILIWLATARRRKR